MPEEDPLGVILLCSNCHAEFDGSKHRPICSCLDGLDPDDERPTWEPYIPLRHVPEDVIEPLRAKLLKMNAKGGPRNLTEEEQAGAANLPPAQVIEPDPEPEPPATGEDIPDELRAELGEGFG